MQSLAEIKQEISLLIEYATPAELRQEAMRLVDRYETDLVALGCRSFGNHLKSL